MKSVLLTRSLEDNNETIRELEKNCSFKYICSPLVQYQALPLNSTILHNYVNIIVTSKFAARILAGLQEVEQKNVWIVGNSSKLILEQRNFVVRYVATNIQDLLENIPQEIYEQTIYLSSNEITQDLPQKITRHIIYQVQYATQLYQIAEIEKGINFILLYSQNSTKTFIELLIKNNLLKLLDNSLVITISEKVANIIRYFAKNVVYCDNGQPQQMLELLIYNAKIRN
ncbi:MAG: palindromic element RPE1 domain-containing protein [Rickettsia endosymbiont of Sergentomyia squamirostris]|uniref:Palindromic element RPE1 domain-containing protein n=1 Tax=Candidatus Tisiphia endosymbiont of Sergentomyia squamirostris TaxID=3113639 RepID=A0AAT9G7Q8_9RICK